MQAFGCVCVVCTHRLLKMPSHDIFLCFLCGTAGSGHVLSKFQVFSDYKHSGEQRGWKQPQKHACLNSDSHARTTGELGYGTAGWWQQLLSRGSSTKKHRSDFRSHISTLGSRCAGHGALPPHSVLPSDLGCERATVHSHVRCIRGVCGAALYSFLK